jgi:hypothetical protein
MKLQPPAHYLLDIFLSTLFEKPVSTQNARPNSRSETTLLLTDTTPIVETHDDTYLATLTLTPSNDETSLPASAHFP